MVCTATEKLQKQFPSDVVEFLIDEDGCDPAFPTAYSDYQIVMLVGFQYEVCSPTIALSMPNTWVVTVDFCPDTSGLETTPPNLVCATYLEDEASYVAGYLAGQMTSTKVVGVAAGPAVPPVIRLMNGFAQGVRAACPSCMVEGMHLHNFFEPDNAIATTDYMVNQLGADVIFGCGGGTGSVAIGNAAELGAYVVGVDKDE